MKEPIRIRRSLHELEKEHNDARGREKKPGEETKPPSELELIIKTFRGIQELDADNHNSFFQNRREVVPNPLFSYKLQQGIKHNIADYKDLYTKHLGYETVRYPLSGRVGTPQDQEESAKHNAKYPDPVINAQLLINTGAFGEMGNNETAGFDPIFYLHHAFIDYAFWLWQIKNKQTEKLDMRAVDDQGVQYPGASTGETGLPYLPKNTILGVDTPLHPFRRKDQTYKTSQDVTNITAMGYGREPILGRIDVKECQNCQTKLEVESLIPIYEGMLEAIAGSPERILELKFMVAIRFYDGTVQFPDADDRNRVRPGPRIGNLD
ncbi:Tyrosinase [Escovopsis weberi]|uniref:Tyrosinase n=1 Tax=Escovopsis weberi TaxID=150374 RepID=A0A0M8N5H8_ESCWE|nr:Tyrosinase [Escovopsis weberi]